ncbi:hypothetical protein [Cognatiyoonia sp. IB215446]|nr:hypothetical protein [Cognatiyoonia sp. IB215446]
MEAAVEPEVATVENSINRTFVTIGMLTALLLAAAFNDDGTTASLT